jgi:hypothetical protein
MYNCFGTVKNQNYIYIYIERMTENVLIASRKYLEEQNVGSLHPYNIV